MAPPPDDESRYHGVLETLGDLAREIREHKAAVEQAWQLHRQTVNSAIGLLSSELVRLQHIFDQFVGERKAEREQDEAGRKEARAEARRYRWTIIIGLVVLIVVNLLVLVYLIGRGR